MKRRSLRSINGWKSMSTAPATWLRMPRASYSGRNTMPLLPVCSEVRTVGRSVPMQETMPIPVTTTRRIKEPLTDFRFTKYDQLNSETGVRHEEPNAQAGGGVNDLAVDRNGAVGNAHHELALDQP